MATLVSFTKHLKKTMNEVFSKSPKQANETKQKHINKQQ
jgi:hypothetical protein